MGPGKVNVVPNLKERPSSLWFAKEPAPQRQNSDDILPGGPRLHPSKRGLAAPGQFVWIGKRSLQYFGERGNVAAGKDEITIHGSYEVGGGETTILSLARGLAELGNTHGLNRCTDIFLG